MVCDGRGAVLQNVRMVLAHACLAAAAVCVRDRTARRRPASISAGSEKVLALGGRAALVPSSCFGWWGEPPIHALPDAFVGLRSAPSRSRSGACDGIRFGSARAVTPAPTSTRPAIGRSKRLKCSRPPQPHGTEDRFYSRRDAAKRTRDMLCTACPTTPLTPDRSFGGDHFF